VVGPFEYGNEFPRTIKSWNFLISYVT